MYKNERYVLENSIAILNEVKSNMCGEPFSQLDFVARKLQGLLDDDDYYRQKKEKNNA